MGRNLVYLTSRIIRSAAACNSSCSSVFRTIAPTPAAEYSNPLLFHSQSRRNFGSECHPASLTFAEKLQSLGFPKQLEHLYTGDLDSPIVTDPARFAVQEHNRLENKQLQFVGLNKVSFRCLCGTIYHLAVDTFDGTEIKQFLAIVYLNAARDWDMELHSFRHNPRDQLRGYDLASGMHLYWNEIAAYWGPMDDAVVVEPAQFAVEEYNKKKNKHLKFVELKDVKVEMYRGYMFHLVLIATDGVEKKVFLAKVLQHASKGWNFELHLFRTSSFVFFRSPGSTEQFFLK